MTPSKPKRRSTINEVAERAGVAKTTVSHALSGKRPVAPETRERIFAAMRELQYSPSPVARRLAGSPSHAIALVLPLASPSISDVEVRFIAAIGDVINRRGYTFLTLTSPQVDVDDLRQIVYSGLVDGVVLMRIQVHDERVKLLKETDIPFVMIGRTRDNKGLTYVDLNGEAAIAQAVEYLLQLGHNSIGFVCPDDLNFAFAYRIMKGYEKVCQQQTLEPISVAAGMAADAGYRATFALLDEHPATTAVIVWSDGRGVWREIESAYADRTNGNGRKQREESYTPDLDELIYEEGEAVPEREPEFLEEDEPVHTVSTFAPDLVKEAGVDAVISLVGG